MGKLCTDQLIGKLVALLREADPDKFDDAVVEARNQLTAESKQAKRNDLEKLFDAHIATLKDRGVPEQIVEILQNQKGSVVKKASEMAIGDGNIPFLPVIPRSFRSPYDLMAMVRNGSKVGYTYLNPTQISDVVDAPQEPYYIYDVEDGNSTRGKSPENAEKILKQQKRSPLTAAEVTALTTHTDVLSRHYVWAAGSRVVSAGKVPDVYLSGGVRPRLSWGGVDGSDGRWAGALRLAVVARTLDIGFWGLLVFGLGLPPQFFPPAVGEARQRRQVASSDTTRAVRCITHDLPFLFLLRLRISVVTDRNLRYSNLLSFSL